MTNSTTPKASTAPVLECETDLKEMRVFKLSAHIGHEHRLVIQLPIDVPEGAAEVIVSFPSVVPNETLNRCHLENLL